MNQKLQVGQHLYTRDGREIGNAIVVDIHDSPTGLLVDIETDFGNPGRKLNPAEVNSLFHVANADGDVAVSDLARWRADRADLRGEAMNERIEDARNKIRSLVNSWGRNEGQTICHCVNELREWAGITA